ncbi:heme peroxidase [Basidiobolus meristosporus CBS 931.73]|uniref:Peroxidase n=1 Tax=Basidiobolus meristosporus CBS 931.73 TaxID=1314790 RepID=A0A1Y1YFJ1_9FUNG|nr:heme peroxidase [Basidiobolus meristosporus CBS 931.73]|eukprot:ORX96718.1 heme peroxidase [Basidiobolus meristosporus CBS 931.73]
MTSQVGDYNAVRRDIIKAIPAERYDKGTYGPSMIQLTWHSCGTYDQHQNNGGSQGGTMRFPEQYSDHANKGLENARNALEPVHEKHPWITYADLYTLGGCVAVEQMGGPHIPWTPGRWDTDDKNDIPARGRLPEGSYGKNHVIDVFIGRLGMSVQETAALIGAHCVGECHKSHQGYDGPWTETQTQFTNNYYKMLLTRTWKEKKNWNGPRQFEDEETHKLMMIPAEMAFLEEPFRPWVELYASDQEKWFEDFKNAFVKLCNLGTDRKPGDKNKLLP